MDTSREDAGEAGVRPQSSEAGTAAASTIKTLAGLPPDFRYKLSVSPGALAMMKSVLETAAMAHRLSPFTKARIRALAEQIDTIIQAGPSEAEPILLEDIGILEDLNALEEREREAGATKAAPCWWEARWSRANGKPLIDKLRPQASATSLYDFYRAVKRIRRTLPNGALEWAAEAIPGDKAKFLDARNDVLVVLEVSEIAS